MEKVLEGERVHGWAGPLALKIPVHGDERNLRWAPREALPRMPLLLALQMDATLESSAHSSNPPQEKGSTHENVNYGCMSVHTPPGERILGGYLVNLTLPSLFRCVFYKGI